MLKFFIIIIILLFTGSMLIGQQLNAEDYKVYSALIKTEISTTKKSVEIIREPATEDDGDSILVVDGLRSKNPDDYQQLIFLMRSDKGGAVRSIDSTTENLLLRYYESRPASFVLANGFNLNTKVTLLKKTPINRRFKKDIDKGWKRFYEKYPGSGGLFQFSKIYYSPDKRIAIFYHWLRRGGLNGFGALTIMENTNGNWKVKYHIYMWET